jgi:hypothetical protein
MTCGADEVGGGRTGLGRKVMISDPSALGRLREFSLLSVIVNVFRTQVGSVLLV